MLEKAYTVLSKNIVRKKQLVPTHGYKHYEETGKDDIISLSNSQRKAISKATC